MMNDRYLFRGKRLADSEWHVGNLAKTGQDHENDKQGRYLRTVECFQIKPDRGSWQCVDPVTIGQCTGLRDKNGTLIFEGDVLTNPDWLNDVKGIVKFGSEVCGFWIYWGTYYANTRDILFWANECSLEIIGNIHDNENLMNN